MFEECFQLMQCFGELPGLFRRWTLAVVPGKPEHDIEDAFAVVRYPLVFGVAVVALLAEVEGEQVAAVHVFRLEVVGKLLVGIFMAAFTVPEFYFEDELLFEVVNHQVHFAVVAGFGFIMIEACAVY